MNRMNTVRLSPLFTPSLLQSRGSPRKVESVDIHLNPVGRPYGRLSPLHRSPKRTPASPRGSRGSPKISSTSPNRSPKISSASPRGSPKISSASPKLTSASPRGSRGSPKRTSASPKLTSASPNGSPKLTSASPRGSRGSPKLTSASPRGSRGSPKLTSASPKLSSAFDRAPPRYDPKVYISVLSQQDPNIIAYVKTSRAENRRLYPQKVLAIYYITMIYENMNWIIAQFKPIVGFIKKAEELDQKYLRDHIHYDLHELHKEIDRDLFKYKSEIDEYNIIKDYTYIRLLARRQTDSYTDDGFQRDRKDVMIEERYSYKQIKSVSNKLYDDVWESTPTFSNMQRQAHYYQFNKSYGFIDRIKKKLREKKIDIKSIKLKLEAQYNIIQKFIDILNGLWKDDNVKEDFNNFVVNEPHIHSSQNGSGLNDLFNISLSRKEPEEDYMKLIYMYRRANFDNFYKILEHLNRVHKYIKYKYKDVKDNDDILYKSLISIEVYLKFIAEKNLNIEQDLDEIYPISLTT